MAAFSLRMRRGFGVLLAAVLLMTVGAIGITPVRAEETPQPFLSIEKLEGPRNTVENDPLNYVGWVGMKITVRTAPLTVYSLGRLASTDEHRLLLLDAATGADITGQTLTVSGGKDGEMTYAALTAPVTLEAGKSYYLVTDILSLDDLWYDAAKVTHTEDATLDGAVIREDDFTFYEMPGGLWGPVDFLYQLEAPLPTVRTQSFTTEGITPAGERNVNYTGWVGTRITVGDEPLTVTAVGRLSDVKSQTQHSMLVVDAATGGLLADNLTVSGGVPGEFSYTALATPVTLEAGKSYYIVTDIRATDDLWYADAKIVHTNVAKIDGPVHMGLGSQWSFTAKTGKGFGPVDFRYRTADGEESYVTSCTPEGARNISESVLPNFAGWGGMQITVGDTPLTVTSFGRYQATGSDPVHSMLIVSAATGAVLAEAHDLQGEPGGFIYADLPSPLTLTPGASYYVVTDVRTLTDVWYDSTVSAHTEAATLDGIATLGTAGWEFYPAENIGWGPVDFRYETVTSDDKPEPPPEEPVKTATFLTDFTLEGERNVTEGDPLNYAGWVGIQITVGDMPLKVTALGRIHTAGSRAEHNLIIIDAETDAVICDGVKASGGEEGKITYVDLDAPVTLEAGKSYYIATDILDWADVWYDGVQLRHTTDASLDGTVLMGLNGWESFTQAKDLGWGPVDFRYEVTEEPLEAPGWTDTAFVTGAALAGARNQTAGDPLNYIGWVGSKIVVGQEPIWLSALGRMHHGGPQRHQVMLLDPSDVDPATGQPRILRNVTVFGRTDGEFAYTALNEPVELAAGSTYYIVTDITDLAETWYDAATLITTDAAALKGAVCMGLNGFEEIPTVDGVGWGPVSFRYLTDNPQTGENQISAVVVATLALALVVLWLCWHNRATCKKEI